MPRLVGFDRKFSTCGMSIYSVCERLTTFRCRDTKVIKLTQLEVLVAIR